MKADCYNFANFFLLFPDIEITRYHFLFIFKGCLKEDKASMELWNNNNIKYIKFCQINDEEFFLSPNNDILKKIIFDMKNYSLVDIISNKTFEYI